MNASCQLHAPLLVDCSIQLGRPQRRLCRLKHIYCWCMSHLW